MIDNITVSYIKETFPPAFLRMVSKLQLNKKSIPLDKLELHISRNYTLSTFILNMNPPIKIKIKTKTLFNYMSTTKAFIAGCKKIMSRLNTTTAIIEE